METVFKSVDRRRAQRRADWHNHIDRPSRTGVGYDFWVSFHGPPCRYEVRRVEGDEFPWHVVAVPDLEVVA